MGIINKFVKLTNEEMYLDYVNNFLTVERFAEFYELTEKEAREMLVNERIKLNTKNINKGGLKMINLAELKRLQVGSKLKLVKYYFGSHRSLGVIRAIKKKQSNAIIFDNGSWLYYPKAKEFKPTEKGFIVLEKKTLDTKTQDILIKQIENGEYTEQSNRETNNKHGAVARHKDKFYFISNENINKVMEKAKTYEEYLELLEYELINN